MSQFTKIKNVDGTIPGFFGGTLCRASEAENEALRSGRAFKPERRIAFEDIAWGKDE